MTLSGKLFNRLILIALAIGFLAVGVAGILTWRSTVSAQTQNDLVTHTYQVQRTLARLLARVERLETTRRGMLLSSDQRFVRAYRETSAEVPAIADQLVDLTGPNSPQSARIVALRRDINLHLADLRGWEAKLRDSGRGALAAKFSEDAAVDRTRTFRRRIDGLVATEQRLLDDRVAAQNRSLRQLYAVLIVAGLLFAATALAAFLTLMRYTRDLSASRDRLGLLNENLEGAVAERTADLQRANDEIQRFAYIVSHDLRAPLVNVMGFTAELDTAAKALRELIDKAEAEAPALVGDAAKLAAREDLPEAIGFIRSSTQKMDRLINAILSLSREGRRTLKPIAIDTDELVQGIADSLEHRISDAGAAIEVKQPLPAIVSDRLAIEQILSNLVENAVKYLKPGRPGHVTVSGEKAAGRVVFSIADNGRGIDPKDHERIFDLFRRSGAQDQPGEGIGLAHVRALAYRLGGTISCDSRLDEGAIFRLSLPATYQDAEGTAS